MRRFCAAGALRYVVAGGLLFGGVACSASEPQSHIFAVCDAVVLNFPAGTIVDVSSLPETIIDSGLRSPDAELWIEEDRSAMYLVGGDQARKLPLDPTTEAANCA